MCCAGSRACTCVLRVNYFGGSFGNGVVTVFAIEVVGDFATVVVTFAAVVVGGVAPPIAGIGVVTVLASVVSVFGGNPAVFAIEVVVADAIEVVVAFATVVDGRIVLPSVVSVFGTNAAFFVFGVVISVSVGESEPPQALTARRAEAVRARAVARGEIFISAN